ncbi:MAG TPA: hypothetical protein PLD46_01950, partial [Hyphomicrobium sp.]|nr:hypothetical protein [Hyphomicrobium sp.]
MQRPASENAPASGIAANGEAADGRSAAAAPGIVRNADIAEGLTVNNFDFLRLIFAAMVMIFHIGVLSQQPQLSWLQHWSSGAFGLQGKRTGRP